MSGQDGLDRAVVIGVGPGLGGAIARRFARGGLRVTGLTRDPAKLAPIPEVTVEPGDVGDLSGLAAAVTAGGPVSVLVFNASAMTMVPGPSALDPDALTGDFRVNVAAPLAATRAVLPAMLAAGRGTVLFTGGGLAFDPTGWLAAASLAVGKAGLRSLAYSLHAELAPRGVHVGTVTVTGTIAPGTAFDPDAIAEAFWSLHAEAPDAWQAEIVFKG